MRPLKSHFPDHALQTLDTLFKQTKEARVFRRAQAVREVVAGHHINAVSEAFHLANSALRKRGRRACGIARALGDRPNSPVSWNSTSSASLSKTPWSTAHSIPNGVVARWRPSLPVKPVSTWAAKVSAVG